MVLIGFRLRRKAALSLEPCHPEPNARSYDIPSMKKGRTSQRLRAGRSGLDFLRSLNQIKPRQCQPYDGKAVHAP
jgi:hypothetical protein